MFTKIYSIYLLSLRVLLVMKIGAKHYLIIYLTKYNIIIIDYNYYILHNIILSILVFTWHCSDTENIESYFKYNSLLCGVF